MSAYRAPELTIRMLIVGYCFGIRAEAPVKFI